MNFPLIWKVKCHPKNTKIKRYYNKTTSFLDPFEDFLNSDAQSLLLDNICYFSQNNSRDKNLSSRIFCLFENVIYSLR